MGNAAGKAIAHESRDINAPGASAREIFGGSRGGTVAFIARIACRLLRQNTLSLSARIPWFLPARIPWANGVAD